MKSERILHGTLYVVSGARVDHRHTNRDSQRVSQYKGTWTRDFPMGISQERIFRFSKYANGLNFENIDVAVSIDLAILSMILIRIKMHEKKSEIGKQSIGQRLISIHVSCLKISCWTKDHMITYLWTELTRSEFRTVSGKLILIRRVSGVTLGGYKRNPLAPHNSRLASLCDYSARIFSPLLGCDLHLRQDHFAASFKNKIKSKTPIPNTVRLTIKASEALLGTLPKKEKDPGSPLITATIGDVVIRNTLLDLGASVNLADQSTKVSHGKLTNVIVKVGDFFYPVDFLVMEYESLEDAPALILGRPFLATAGAVIDYKTGDLDIFFGTRKRRLNMFGSPISLPQGYDDKQLDSSMLMEPGIRDKSKIWTQTGEGGKEEVLKKTKEHPLSTIDKEQLLNMMEMLEARHQQYEKDAREREAKVFQLLEAQQHWISGFSDTMTQITSLMSMMAHKFMPDYKKPPSRIQEE
ncbi:hypothetical protein L1887_42207 [Cichorium endivia]|nr:hypothetical protein L1887_42207 [Cichorium endivia]